MYIRSRRIFEQLFCLFSVTKCEHNREQRVRKNRNWAKVKDKVNSIRCHAGKISLIEFIWNQFFVTLNQADILPFEPYFSFRQNARLNKVFTLLHSEMLMPSFITLHRIFKKNSHFSILRSANFTSHLARDFRQKNHFNFFLQIRNSNIDYRYYCDHL